MSNDVAGFSEVPALPVLAGRKHIVLVFVLRPRTPRSACGEACEDRSTEDENEDENH